MKMGLNSMESFDPSRSQLGEWTEFSSNMEEALERRSGTKKNSKNRHRGSHQDLQFIKQRSANSLHNGNYEQPSDTSKGTCFYTTSYSKSISNEERKDLNNNSKNKEQQVQMLLHLKPSFSNNSRSLHRKYHQERAKEEVTEKYIEDEMKKEKSVYQEADKEAHPLKEKIYRALDEIESCHDKGREPEMVQVDSNRLWESTETQERNIFRSRQRCDSQTNVKEPCYPPVQNEEFVPEKGDLSKDEILESLSKNFTKHGCVEWKVLEKVELSIPDVLIHLFKNGTITMKQILTELAAIQHTYGPESKTETEDEYHYQVDCSKEQEEKIIPVEEKEEVQKKEETSKNNIWEKDYGGLDKEALSIEFKEQEIEMDNRNDNQHVEKSGHTENLILCKNFDVDFCFLKAKLLELENIANELLSHQFNLETVEMKSITNGKYQLPYMEQGIEKTKQKSTRKSNSEFSFSKRLWYGFDGFKDCMTDCFLWSGLWPPFKATVNKTRTCKGDFNPDAPNGRGDNSWNETAESDSDRQNSHGSQRSDEQEETEKEKQGRRNDDEKDKDENENPPKGDGNHSNKNEDRVTRNLEVVANFKYRRKHGSVQGGESGLIDLLGLILNENDELKVPPDIFDEINLCLMTSMQVKSAGETTNCYICSHLSALICHFGSCTVGFHQASCQTCLTMFRLIQKHVSICGLSDSFTSEVTCPVIICVKIKRAEITFDHHEKVWRKLKKNLARFANPDTEDDDAFSSLSSLSSVGSIASGKLPSVHAPGRARLSTVTRPTVLESIPEGGVQMGLTSPRKSTNKSGSRSEPIMMRKLDGTVVMTTNLPKRLLPEGQINIGPSSLPQSRFSSLGIAPYSARLPRDICTDSTDHPLLPDPKLKLNSPKDGSPGFSFETIGSPRESAAADFIYARSMSESDGIANNSLPTAKDSSLEHLSTNGSEYISLPSYVFGLGEQNDYKSIPINRQQSQMWERYQSLVDRPTGIPGIKDVVYGERQILLAVARIWFNNKNQLINGKKDSREEGVILPVYQDRLKILKTRYSKNFQWVRLSHLGSGTSGKCHLAMDFTTDFKFCIKKIHISKYEVKELEIWSELQHKNIVQLIGTLRRGEKIYIMSEFIDGGCLTETINQQRSLSRRLSQKTALNYLKQILEALMYLQKKYVIHEDLKADNILVRSGTQDIVVTDFGVARKHTSAKDKRGSTTSGSQIVFSPEKARGEGHGYKSDLWSAICVFYHMLTGYPPWVRKYPNLGALLYVIIEQTPDIPGNVEPDIYDLIKKGFEKDPSLRPGPEELLGHKAFKLIDGFGPDILYSTLMSSVHHVNDATKLQQSDLKEELKILGEIEEELKSIDISDAQLSLRKEENRRCPVENEEPSDTENCKISSLDIRKIALDLGVSLPDDVAIREEEPPNDPLQQFLIDSGEITINQAGLQEWESSTEKQSSDTEQSFSDLDFEENPQSILPVFQLLFSKEENLTEKEKQDKQEREQVVEDHHERVLNSQLSRSESHNRSFDSQLSSQTESSEIQQEKIFDHISKLPNHTKSSLEVPNLTLFKDSSSLSSEKVTLKVMSGSTEQSDSKDSEKSTLIATTISSPQGTAALSTASMPSPPGQSSKTEIFQRPTSTSPSIVSSMFSIEEEDDFSEDDMFGSGEGIQLLTTPNTLQNKFFLGNSNNNTRRTTPTKLYLDLSPASRRRKLVNTKPSPNTADIQSNTSPIPPTAPYYTPQTQKPPPFQTPSKSNSSHLLASGLSKSSSHGSTENSGALSSSLSQHLEEYERLMDEISNTSGHGAELSTSPDIDNHHQPVVEFGLGDDDDMDASMAYVNENYLNAATNAHGIRVMIHHKESEKTFTMEIFGCTVQQSWKEIIQNECSDYIQGQMNVTKFILLDGNNKPLDLHRSPSQGEQFLYVQELDDITNVPWYCEQGMIM